MSCSITQRRPAGTVGQSTRPRSASERVRTLLREAGGGVAEFAGYPRSPNGSMTHPPLGLALPDSSRIRPANDQETSRSGRRVSSIEFAGHRPDSANRAGSEIGPENTLKVETRVRTPLGLPGKTQVRGPVRLRRADMACSRPAFVPRRFSHYQYDRGITLREAARLQSFPNEFEFVRPRLQVARQIGWLAPSRCRSVGHSDLPSPTMPLPKSSSSEPITVLGKAGVSNLPLAFR
jgi:site-specific DNA-cytosine methylase